MTFMTLNDPRIKTAVDFASTAVDLLLDSKILVYFYYKFASLMPRNRREIAKVGMQYGK